MPKKELTPEEVEAKMKGIVETARRVLELPPSENGSGVFTTVDGPDGEPLTIELPMECLESKEKMLAFIEACNAPKAKA